MSSTDLILAAAGTGGGDKLYVDDVFSTYLYTGNGSTQTITNGIDLAGEGGLVWTKPRNNAFEYHHLVDTVRGGNNALYSNDTSAQSTASTYITSFNSNGFTLGTSSGMNGSGLSLASWTFRKAPKFFDVVTYTGTGSARTISHNLGSAPGMIIVKRLNSAIHNWMVYHRSLPSAAYYLSLNTTDAQDVSSSTWSSTAPTSSVFSVGSDTNVNESGGTYVAYLFAHDAGGFGESGEDNVISCGSFTYGVSGDVEVNLGWEPQYVLVKRVDGAGGWWILDTMRGYCTQKSGTTLTNITGGNMQALFAETTGAESQYDYGGLTNTGFKFPSNFNGGTGTTKYIYMAIRRPMKPPTSGTEVFLPYTYTSPTSQNTPTYIDTLFLYERDGANIGMWQDRLRGTSTLNTRSDSAETTGYGAAYNAPGFKPWTPTNVFGTSLISYVFKRASEFYDVVCFTGNATNRTLSHSLNKIPELVITKKRSDTADWAVYHKDLGNTKYLYMNTTNAVATSVNAWASTTPTSSVFSVGSFTATNTGSMVAYLFATCSGVSKVGSYTGTGTTQTINCGFAGGSRFVMIKRTDSTGDWYVWDTARGIVSGNDPYLLMNSTAAEVTSTDYIDPVSSGFEISSTAPDAINASGGSFIYLAIA